jgi:hypothetical protein
MAVPLAGAGARAARHAAPVGRTRAVRRMGLAAPPPRALRAARRAARAALSQPGPFMNGGDDNTPEQARAAIRARERARLAGWRLPPAARRTRWKASAWLRRRGAALSARARLRAA